MASLILCGTPAVVCEENSSGVKSLNTLTGDITLTATGGLITPAGPNTLNIGIPEAPLCQTPTFVDSAGIIGLGAQNAFANGTSIEIPLTWSATLSGILNPAGPAPPVGSGVSLCLGGFTFLVSGGALANGTIDAQLTDNAGIDYPVLQPLTQVDNAVGATAVPPFSISTTLPDVLIDANGLHASGMPVGANSVYLRISNTTGTQLNLVSIPSELQTVYYPSVAP